MDWFSQTLDLGSHLIILAQNIREIDEFGLQHANQSFLHPASLAALALCVVLVQFVPRSIAIFTLLAYLCAIPSAHRLALFTLDLHFTRLLVLAGLIRILTRGEWTRVTLNKLDYGLVVFAMVKTLIYTIQQGSFAGLIYQIGASYDLLGGYFMVRCLTATMVDIKSASLSAAIIALPVFIAFLIERATGNNPFAIFGGVPAQTVIRQEKLRCQGPFPHPIIAGCFWSSLLPLIALPDKRRIVLKTVGLFAGLFIIVCTNSSTPLAGAIAALVGFAFFPLRGKMKYVFWATIFLLVCLHFSMKAPVWHLISRVSLSHGSTSYFRFQILDSTIRRFSEWALFGTKSTAHWFWGAQDLTNQYVLEAVHGGALTLICFSAVLYFAFNLSGKSIRNMAELGPSIPWALGVMLFVHCVNFIGVSYFGQASFLFVFTLALISSTYDFTSAFQDSENDVGDNGEVTGDTEVPADSRVNDDDAEINLLSS